MPQTERSYGCEMPGSVIPLSYHSDNSGKKHQHYLATFLWSAMITAASLSAVVFSELDAVVGIEDNALQSFGDGGRFGLGIFTLGLSSVLVATLAFMIRSYQLRSTSGEYDNLEGDASGEDQIKKTDETVDLLENAPNTACKATNYFSCETPTHAFAWTMATAGVILALVSAGYPPFFSLFSGLHFPNGTNPSNVTNVTTAMTSLFSTVSTGTSNGTSTVAPDPLVLDSDLIGLIAGIFCAGLIVGGAMLALHAAVARSTCCKKDDSSQYDIV